MRIRGSKNKQHGKTIVHSLSEFGQITDLDDDGIMEIVTAFRDGNDEPDYKIYKFNGSEYFLWYEGGYPLNTKKEDNNLSSTTKFKPKSYRDRAEAEGISPREAQIKNYLEFPETFPSGQFDGRTFSLVVFGNSHGRYKVRNFEGQRNSSRPGIMVFEGDNRIWEDKDEYHFDAISVNDVYLRDLTGDNIPEIIGIDSGGGNRPGCTMSAYRWDGEDSFDPIIPLPDEGYIEPCSSEKYGDSGGARDIDGDGVFELITYVEERIYPEADYGTPLYYERESKKLIYKFNGSKYLLWKKE